MTIMLPMAFDHLRGKDANFEMVSSNTIQPIMMHFQENVLTNSISYIFLNTDCNGLGYDDAKLKGQKMEELFTEILEFHDV